jgi:transposase
MYYVGLDVHARRSTLEILDCHGKSIKSMEVRGAWPVLLQRIEREVPRPFAICYEASCGYGYLHDRLARLAQRVTVAHPGQLRLIFKSKRKNDRIDGRKLAKVLYLDAVPAVHVPGVDVRQWRALIEYRQRLLGRRVTVKNQLRALLRGNGIMAVKALWTRAGLAWLAAQALSELDDLRRAMMLEELAELGARIKRVEAALEAIAARHPGVALLRTIPGVGIRTAEAFVAYVDDVARFASVKRASSYFGLVPCQDASGPVNRLGHITKDGPATVRKLLCEASWQGVRRSPTIRAFFARIARGDADRKKIALVAVAQYLVRVMTAMLRDGQAWRETTKTTDTTANAA